MGLTVESATGEDGERVIQPKKSKRICPLVFTGGGSGYCHNTEVSRNSPFGKLCHTRASPLRFFDRHQFIDSGVYIINSRFRSMEVPGR